jgi:hypothetical protein
VGQVQAEPELRERNAMSISFKKIREQSRETIPPSHPQDVINISRVVLEGSSTPALHVNNEVSKDSSASKPKVRVF